MERFCNKCGSLVSGDGVFCPNCGGKLDSAVDLGKPASQAQDVTPVGSSTPASSSIYGSANTNGTYGTTPPAANTVNSTGNTGGYQGQMPSYSQPVQPVNMKPEMNAGQWALTIFLSSLGIIGIILLFVWAFGSDTQSSKRNYARGMLILDAIVYGLSILFLIGSCACAGCAFGDLTEMFEDMSYYAAIGRTFIG